MWSARSDQMFFRPEVAKLVLTPLLIGVAACVSRRWGSQMGGWLAGLPLTSGPLSVFVAIEQGLPFARQAATHTLLGLSSLPVFAIVYRTAAVRCAWPLALAAALCAWCAAAAAFSRMHDSAVLAVCLAVVALITTLPFFPPQLDRADATNPWWDIPARASIATATVWVLSAVAPKLGPQSTGLISPFPVFAAVMCCFAHAHTGRSSAVNVLRGVILGSFGFAAFFFCVSTQVERFGLWVYLIASAAALALNGTVLLLTRRSGDQIAAGNQVDPARDVYP